MRTMLLLALPDAPILTPKTNFKWSWSPLTNPSFLITRSNSISQIHQEFMVTRKKQCTNFLRQTLKLIRTSTTRSSFRVFSPFSTRKSSLWMHWQMESRFTTPIVDYWKSSDLSTLKSKRMSFFWPSLIVKGRKELELYWKTLLWVFGTSLITLSFKKSYPLHPVVHSIRRTFGTWSIFRPGSQVTKQEPFTFGTLRNKFHKEKYSASTKAKSMMSVKFHVLISWLSRNSADSIEQIPTKSRLNKLK